MSKRESLSIEDIAKRYCRSCHYCGRIVPTYDFFTDRGCIFCDEEWHYRRKK